MGQIINSSKGVKKKGVKKPLQTSHVTVSEQTIQNM